LKAKVQDTNLMTDEFFWGFFKVGEVMDWGGGGKEGKRWSEEEKGNQTMLGRLG
jgi:hypothetical protein